MTVSEAMARAIDRHEVRVAFDVQERLAAYVELLSQHGARTNLVGTTHAFRIADEMVVDSLRLTSLIEAPMRAIDVGTGAGLPGVPLAIAWPRTQFTLVEPREKRVLFLRTVVRRLGLTNVEVFRGRIEEFEPPGPVGLAVSKAVFAPDRWLEVARPLVDAEGTIAVYANGDADEAAYLLPQDASVRSSATYSLADGRLRTLFVVER